MSILVDKEISHYLNQDLKEGGIEIDPMTDPKTQIQPASVDLCLGNEFTGITNGMNEIKRMQMLAGGGPPDPAMQQQLQERLTLDPRKEPPENTYSVTTREDDDFLVLPPMAFMLGTTKERIALPADIVARVEGKSSFGRLGIAVHSTAGYIDPGFNGQITLEIYNHAPRPVKLYVGDPVCQVVFERTRAKAHRPYGHPSRNSKYQGQKGTTISRSFETHGE